MAQTKEGAIKTAAKAAGLSVYEYLDFIAHGLKKCSFCKRWLSIDDFNSDKSRGDGKATGCKNCKRALWRIKDMESPQKRIVRRDGDKKQARARINTDVQLGLRPNPNDLHCVFCGHKGKDHRHEYHHLCGYATEHHYDVVPVCSLCHGAKSFELTNRERDENGRFI